MRRLLSFVLAFFGIFAICLTPTLAEKRLALVIGNDRYANLPVLQKAVNDAEAVGNTLVRLGFEVIRGRDLGRQGMIDKLAEFTARLEAGDTALFFFAGHGVAIGGVNYLVPSDVPAASAGAEARVRGASIAEPDIIAEIQAKGARVAVLVLDACRDNPFPRTAGRSVGNTRGLADAKPARGVFTLYSAGIGQTALDRLEPNDRNPNSVFTRVFVEQLAKPGLHIGELAIEVREEVAEIALKARNTKGDADPHEQTPAYYDQTIGGRVFLAGRAVAVEPPKPAAAPPAPAVPVDPDAAARRDFEFAERQNSKEVWEEFLRKHPTGIHAAAARQRLAQVARPVAPVLPVPPRDTAPAVVAPPVRPATPPDTTPKPAVGAFPTSVAPLPPERERALKPKDSFKECDACPEMVVVPAGSFMMGSPAGEKNRHKNEGPQRRVTFAQAFAVGRFSITFDEWHACVSDGGCNGYQPGDFSWGRGRRPVIAVHWHDAKAYVTWLSRRTGKNYRLLSEAEREYVTRAGTTTPFWWGTSISTEQANYRGDNYTYGGGPKGEFRDQTIPVDSFAPNPFGLYQVHGNVSEWVEDCNHNSYRDAPTDGSAWTTGAELPEGYGRGPGTCDFRVLRGGQWNDNPWNVRAAVRSGRETDARSNGTGFRVARTLTAP